MLALLEAFLQIVMRRRGPEDLPDSRFLLELSLGVYLATQVLVTVVFYGWSIRALQAILLDIALLTGCYWMIMTLAGRPTRYRRTLTALLGTGALLALPQAPLVYLAGLDGGSAEAAVGPKLGLLALLVWSIVVQAHITARALSTNFGVGLALALAYFIVSYQVNAQLAPAPG